MSGVLNPQRDDINPPQNDKAKGSANVNNGLPTPEGTPEPEPKPPENVEQQSQKDKLRSDLIQRIIKTKEKDYHTIFDIAQDLEEKVEKIQLTNNFLKICARIHPLVYNSKPSTSAFNS